MSLIEINWQPSRKDLRKFGIVALAATGLAALLLHLLKGLSIQWSAVIFTVGLAIFVVSLLSARVTRIIYLSLIIATLPIGYIVSFTVLAAFYFLLLTPLALIFRLIGRDPLHRRFDSSAKSYWGPHQLPDSLDRYFRQF
jgi:uncharacterized membrane protein YgdD (TMEM256/DUF423 family)